MTLLDFQPSPRCSVRRRGSAEGAAYDSPHEMLGLLQPLPRPGGPKSESPVASALGQLIFWNPSPGGTAPGL